MFRLITMATLLFVSSGTYALEQGDCAATEHNFNQCSFEIPAVSDGDTVIVDSVSNSLFKGKTAASCSQGFLNIGKSSCDTVVESSCDIPPSSWVVGENMCSHDAVMLPLTDGSEITVSSKDKSGSVVYTCQSGSLQASKLSCGVSPIKAKSASVTTQNTRTESKPVELVFFTKYDSATNPGQVKAAAIKRANEVKGYDTSVDLTVIGPTPHGAGYLYDVNFMVKQTGLRCDQGLEVGWVNSVYNERDGEYSTPPGYDEIMQFCTSRGYTGVTENLFTGRTYPFVIDDYTAVMVCEGKQSDCSASPALGNPVITEALSCSSAKVRSGLLKVVRGASVSSAKVQSEVCGPLGFEVVDSFEDPPRLEDETGSFQFYTVNAQCSGYTQGDAEPLTEECATKGTNNTSLRKTSCDTGVVTGFMAGNLNPQTMEYDLAPSNAQVLSDLCGKYEFATLDSIDTMQRSGSNSNTQFYVTAQCSGYYGEGSELCGDCYGDQVSADAEVPKLELDGVFYENLCEKIVEPGPEVCEDCPAGNFTFQGVGATSGNSCTVSAPSRLSGEVRRINFANTSVNGTVEFLCNNGERSVMGDAVCYKSCPGNVSVGWKDARGGNNCAQIIPSGVYTHEQRVTLSSSLSNTGNSVFECDGVTGEWKQVSGQCLLDCKGDQFWGSGIAFDGTNKNDICRANLASVKSGRTGVLESATYRTTGSTSYSCNDGKVSLSSGSCNMDCSATTVSWGGACRADVSAMTHNKSKSISHGSNPSYAFPSSISGSATASCTDGRVSVYGTCKYIVRTEYSNWTAWDETDRDCSYSPLAETVPEGERFTQSVRCDIDYRRTRSLSNVWNDGSKTFVRTDAENKSDILISSRSATGTKEIESACKYDDNNYIYRYESESNDYGEDQSGSRDVDWVYQGRTIYSYRESWGRSGDSIEESGSRDGFSRGAKTFSDGAGSTWFEESIDHYEICVDDAPEPEPDPEPEPTTGSWSSATRLHQTSQYYTNCPGAIFIELNNRGYNYSSGQAKTGSCSNVGETYNYNAITEYHGGYCRGGAFRQVCQ